jgi:pilus assembly protein CpaB
MRINRPQINTNWLLLGVAIALGAGAVYLSNNVIQRKMAQLEAEAKRGQETVRVVVAKRDMARGETIQGEDMAVREVPKEFIHASAVLPSQFGDFERQRLVAPIKRGEVLLPMHSEGNGNSVFSSTLKKGYRALTFEVDAVNSISGMLRPGDFIDLIYSTKSAAAEQGDVTVPLMSQVAVLATDQTLTKHDDGTGRARTFSTITLEVTPLDADRIIVAKSAGQLTAVLRHPDDGLVNGTRAMSALNLLGPGRKGLTPRTIEYIVGGQGGAAEVKLARIAETLPGSKSPASTRSGTLQGAVN